MKIGHQLLALLAVGALSTNTAFAGHHSHRHYLHGSAAHGYGNHVNASAKTGISTDSAPHNSPAADNVKSEKTGISTDSAPQNSPAADNVKSEKTGISTGAALQNAPVADYGHNQAATAGTGPSGKEGAADTTIDTNMSAHQGLGTIKNSQQRSVTKTKTTKTTKTIGAPSTSLRYNLHNHQQESPVGSNGGLRRNAVGALDPVGSDAGSHRNAVGALVAPNKIAHDKAVEPGSAAGPVTHDLNTKPVGDGAPVNKLSPGAAQNKDRSYVAAALTLVKTNGLGMVGTGLNRRGMSTVALGGPPAQTNINTGVLSGNMFHPKHP